MGRFAQQTNLWLFSPTLLPGKLNSLRSAAATCVYQRVLQASSLLVVAFAFSCVLLIGPKTSN